jgi:hypothetical protein
MPWKTQDARGRDRNKCPKVTAERQWHNVEGKGQSTTYILWVVLARVARYTAVKTLTAEVGYKKKGTYLRNMLQKTREFRHADTVDATW